MTATTHLDALDLRPILQLQAEALPLHIHLKAGDITAIEPAEALLNRERTIVHAFRIALDDFGTSGTPDVVEAAWTIVNTLGTGELGSEIEELRHRALEEKYGPVPDDGIGLAGHDGWVHLVEYVEGGLSIIRFPGTEEEIPVATDQLGIPRCTIG